MIYFCLRNIITIFHQQKNKNPLLIMFYVTSLICLSAAFLGFVDYSVLDMLVRENKIIPQLKLDLAYQLGDESL